MIDRLPRSRGRADALVAAAVVGVALLLSACGGSSPGIARLGRSHPGSNASSSGSNSGLPSSSAGGGASSANALVAGASVKEISATGASYSGAQLLKFAECARANGDPNFPDPTGGGVFVGIVPGSAAIMTAQQKCNKDLPHATASHAQQHLFVKEAVVYAQCMRGHGVLDFPDPTPSGNLELNWRPGTDLDPNSPIFVRANRTCTKLHGALPGGL
ncbi:MAG: hypothetical protein ABSC56_13880 [Solirubrobacteraceae bacterium]